MLSDIIPATSQGNTQVMQCRQCISLTFTDHTDDSLLIDNQVLASAINEAQGRLVVYYIFDDSQFFHYVNGKFFHRGILHDMKGFIWNTLDFCDGCQIRALSGTEIPSEVLVQLMDSNAVSWNLDISEYTDDTRRPTLDEGIASIAIVTD